MIKNNELIPLTTRAQQGKRFWCNNEAVKTRLVALLALAFLGLPSFSSAVTVAELQAQLQVLMAQLSALQSQTQTTAAPPAGGAASASCPNLARNLARGSRGSDVISLQQFLISQKLLASDSATGFFGTMTEAAIKQWQAQNGIASSGTPATTGYGAVGPRTRAALARCTPTPAISVTPTTPSTPNIPATPIVPTTPITPTTPSNPTTPVSCTPLPTQTQTLSCPSGQTGSITQTRISSCAAGAKSPTWSDWQTTLNTCVTTVVYPQSNLIDPFLTKNLWAFLTPGSASPHPTCRNSSTPIWIFNSVSVDGTPCDTNAPSGLYMSANNSGAVTATLSLNNTLNSQRYNSARNYFGIQSMWPLGSKQLLYVPDLKQLKVKVRLKLNPITSVCDDPTNPECVSKQSPIPDYAGKVFPWTTIIIGLPMYDETNNRNLWIEVVPFWTKEAVYGAQSDDIDTDSYLFHGESTSEELHRVKISHSLVGKPLLHTGQEVEYEIDFLSLIKNLKFGKSHAIDWSKVHLGDVYIGTESWGWALTNFDVSSLDILYKK